MLTVDMQPAFSIECQCHVLGLSHLPGLGYGTYVGDEIAIIPASSSPCKITQNHKGYDRPWLTSSCLEKLKCAS